MDKLSGYGYSYWNDIHPCKSNDWLYDETSQWLLTPNSEYSGDTWIIRNGESAYGSVDYNNVYLDGRAVQYVHNVRPTLYLRNDVVIESGTGTIDDPYKLGY